MTADDGPWVSEWRREAAAFQPWELLGPQDEEARWVTMAWCLPRLIVYLLFAPLFVALVVLTGPTIGGVRAARAARYYEGRHESLAALAWRLVQAAWVLVAVAICAGALALFAAVF